MKKNKFKLLVLICLMAVLMVPFFANGTAFADDENNSGNNGPIGIDSSTNFAEISLSADYYLKESITMPEKFKGFDGVFTGKFDGKGYSIKYTTQKPFIEEIGAGAEICNVEFINCSISLVDDGTKDELNYGILAGKINNATISGVKIKDSYMEMGTYIPQGVDPNSKPINSKITTKTNIGLLAGKVMNGATIKNCSIEGNLNLEIGSTTQKINIGGLAGEVGNAKLHNNIVNLYKENKSNLIVTTVTLNSIVESKANFGGLIGAMDFANNFIYNNVVLLNKKSLNIADVLECTIGSFVGNMFLEPYLTNINGFITTYFNEEYIGGRYTNEYTYENFNQYEYTDFSLSVFEDEEIWYDKDEYLWDFKTVWMKPVESTNLIVLQSYETFNITFSTEESINTLNLVDTKPNGNVLSYDIKNDKGESLLPEDSLNNVVESVELDYNQSIEISVTLNSENNYNKFFTIVGLELEGTPIYKISEPQEDYGYGVSIKQSNSDVTPVDEQQGTTVSFVISGINANHTGKYSVILAKNKYYLKTSVFDVGTESTGSLIPGSFTTRENNNPMQTDIIELEYGKTYEITTSISNTDYSDKAYWYLFKNDETDALEGNPINFVPVEQNANYYSRSINFVFNENCDLFKSENANATIFDLTLYKENLDGEENQGNFEINIVYVKRVKQIKIVLMFNNKEEEQIKTQVATLLIATKSDNLIYRADRLEWNEEEGVYYAKMPFDVESPMEYVIKIDQMEAGFEFVDWYYSYDIDPLTSMEEDELAGIFEVSAETNEPLTIYCVFKENTKNLGTNLWWLWVALGVAGLLLLVIIIVIIVKKKRSGGGSSYKKYYY